MGEQRGSATSKGRLVRAGILGAAAGVGAGALLFCLNGLSDRWREPTVQLNPAAQVATAAPEELTLVAFNLAKASFHDGGLSFAPRAEVVERLATVARFLEGERADLVFLSEVVFEAGPAPQDQLAILAEKAGFPYRASGENYSFGFPFYRLRSGNALLSRYPLRGLFVQELPGATPFYAPTNNRRLLWCELALGGEALLVGSVRNDSFDRANNLRQTRALLEVPGERPVLLGGDFNATPGSDSLALLESSGRFAGVFDGPATFPAWAPERRIDYVLAPRAWELVEERVVAVGVSDHRAVVARYRLAP